MIQLPQNFRSAFLKIYFPTFLMAAGAGMIVPAIPFLGKTFAVSPGFAAQVVTAQVLGRALSLIPSGIIHDHFGIRPGMVIGAMFCLVSALLTAFSSHFWLIIVAQFLFGFGLVLWNLGRELAAVDLVSHKQRGRQISALYGIQSTGEVVGPALGGVVLDHFPFRNLFLFFAFLALVILLISLTITTGTKAPYRSKKIPLGFTRISQIAPPFRRTYLVLLFATFCAQLRMEALRSILPLYVVTELGFSATTLGFFFFVSGGITFLMILPAGYISDKYGRKWASAPPAFLAALTFMLYPFAKGFFALLLLSVAQGIISGMALGSMTTYTYDIVPYHVRAQLQVMRRTCGEIGALGGPSLGGFITNHYGAGLSFGFFAPLHLLAALLIAFVARESLPRERSK